MNLYKALSLLLTFLIITNVFALDITSVLNDGQGDFDPWNQTRWAAWYSGGKIVERFDISTDVNFAVRTGDWQPDLSIMPSDMIFYISSGPGIVVDGKGLVVDARPSAYRSRTLSQVYGGGETELEATTTLEHCFRVDQALNPSVTDSTVIQNFTIRGFVQAIRTLFSQRHPLIIQNCTLNRNEWGVYLSGYDTTVTQNQFLENGKGAMYSGALSGKNFITYNTYRDNCYVPFVSYADIVMDTAYKTLIEHNQFIESQYTPTHFSGAISFYRNLGEGGNLREGTPHLNIIRNNSIRDRQIGIHMGARMGRTEGSWDDITQEGRDYGYYNTIQSNYFNDVTIGIKINTSGNKIESNTFTNVEKPIVLNCVFYSLTENTINDQDASNVSFWMKESDYSPYEDWFPHQWSRNRHISESEKFVHIRSDYGSGGFAYTGTATFIESPTLMVDDDAVVADFGSDKKINFWDYAKLADYWQDIGSQFVPVSSSLVSNGLVLQLDMSDVTTTNVGGVNYVTSWNDKTSNDNDAVQTTSAKRPILVSDIPPLGGSAIKFDGTDDYLEMIPNSTFNGGSFTMFAVYAVDAFDTGLGSRRIINLGYADINPGGATQAGPTTYTMVAGGDSTGIRATSRDIANAFVVANSGIPTGYATDTFYVAGMTVDSVSTNVVSYLSDDTSTVSSSIAGSTSVGSGNTVARIGAGTTSTTSTTPANYHNGWISEILVYNRVLTSEEITNVSNYLKNKYINQQDGLDPNFYALNRFIDCDLESCSLDLGYFVSYWLADIPMKDVYSSGGTPIDIAVGDFYEELPGDEVAVIWSAPVSEVSGSITSDTYYTIIIYDSNGIEINRSGRSTHKWAAIAAGDFLADTGDEIAAVSEDANNGYYQVSIFRRGYMTPKVTLLPTNTYPIRDITAGNFLITADSYDEVAVTYDSGLMQIDYAKPTDVNWSATTTGMAGRPLRIAGGHFNKDAEDSVAMITANPIGGYYKIYFYRPGASTAFYTAQNTNTTLLTAIAAGKFNAGFTVDQVAAAGPVVDGVCQIGYYSAYQDGAYRFAGQKAIGTAVAALGCGSLNIPPTLGYYERVEGFNAEQADYGSIVNGWGKQTAVLMQDDQGHSIPIFWISNNSAQTQQKYLKVTPVVR